MQQEINALTSESYEPQIVTYIGQYTQLRRRSGYYTGDCPICGHQDRAHPCFAVKVLPGFVLITCFRKDCGFKGGIYSFIRAIKGCTTFDAINEFREYLGLSPLERHVPEAPTILPLRLISALSGNGKLKTNGLIKRKMAAIYRHLCPRVKGKGDSFIAALAFDRQRHRHEVWTWCFTRCYERLRQKNCKNEQQFLYEIISELNVILAPLRPLKSEAQKRLDDPTKYNARMHEMSFSEYELAMTCPIAHLSKDKGGRRRVAYNGEAVPVCYVKDEINDMEILSDTTENPEDSILAVLELENFENRYGETLLRFRAGLLTVEKTCRNLGISKATLYRIIKTWTQHN